MDFQTTSQTSKGSIGGRALTPLTLPPLIPRRSGPVLQEEVGEVNARRDPRGAVELPVGAPTLPDEPQVLLAASPLADSNRRGNTHSSE